MIISEKETDMKAILFDLDGTIINSEEGITKCVQYALRSFGIDEPDLKKLLCFIGPPLDVIFREKYGFDETQAWQAVEKYRERFDEKGIFECVLYDGVEDAIKQLKEEGYLIALASSKPEHACRRILDHFSLTKYFDMIVGATLDGRISTKQEVLEELKGRMAHFDVSREDMCLIGDTRYDAEGANRFGIRCIGITYGFGTGEQLKEAGAYRVCACIEDAVREIHEMQRF